MDRRPWGSMLKVIHTRRMWIKIIKVNGRTSLQSHNHRIEYHFSIRGIKKVMSKEIHRMEKGLYLELAIGYPEENDIHRYEDDYGRA